MTYEVVLQRLAVADLQGYYDYAAQHSLVDASRWLDRFQIALQSLNERPDRCRIAQENGKVAAELRDFLFGKRPYVFRVVFTIDGDVVRVSRIRRSQRRSLSAEDLRQALADESEQ